ncbi:MAG TPA: isoprenylcysteine carboxylmethyltransferase family protein [Gemmatimonadales bacterium]|nr:isoprenylcysteine carboxylmethyltransferase family protein [Gemmatimonadales bacterium]
MPSPLTLVSVLWGAWLVSWVAAARWTAPTRMRQTVTERLAYTALLLAGVALLVGHPIWLARRVARLDGAVEWGAVALVAAGFAFAWWARLHIGRQWSSDVALKAGHELVRSGPYRITRHPIYTGLLLAIAATAILRDTWAGVLGLGLILASFLVKIGQEERLLTSHFGPSYELYRQEVPRLLPWPRRRSGAEQEPR